VFCMSLCDYLDPFSAIVVCWLEKPWTRLQCKNRATASEKAPDAREAQKLSPRQWEAHITPILIRVYLIISMIGHINRNREDLRARLILSYFHWPMLKSRHSNYLGATARKAPPFLSKLQDG
jgi:hypothetical protein